MTKNFYITYYSNKDKKHITRRGKHDDKSRFWTSREGVILAIHFDMTLGLLIAGTFTTKWLLLDWIADHERL